MQYHALGLFEILCILKLGNGELTLNTMEEIELPQNIISSNNLIDEVFGNCLANGNYEGMKDRDNTNAS